MPDHQPPEKDHDAEQAGDRKAIDADVIDADVIDAELIDEAGAAVGFPAAGTGPTTVQPVLTICLGIATFAAFFVAQVIGFAVMFAYALATRDDFNAIQWAESTPSNGFVLAVCTLFSTAAVVPLAAAFARFVRPDAPADYLGLRWPGAAATTHWILVALMFVAISDSLTWLLGRDVIPPFMRDAYATAGPFPLLWLALVVGAPLCEELIFRGLLLQGLMGTRLGYVGASVVTSVGWALIHAQYDLYGITMVFVIGLLLAACRYTTRSIVPCILMHSTLNLVATIEVAWVVSRG